jgi:hypothetical protein
MTSERPGEADRAEKWHRLLDLLASQPPSKRVAAMHTLGIRLNVKQERLLLNIVAIWESGDGADEGLHPHDAA